MTAEQFEQHGKRVVFDKIMRTQGLSEEEKMKLAEAQLKDIVAKQMQELNDKKVKEYEDKVMFGRHGWKERYYYEKFEVKGEEALT